MDLNTFDNYAKAGKCPICGNNNLYQGTNEFGKTILTCSKCDGLPANCNGTLYVHSGRKTDSCELCGASPAHSNTHGVLMLWLS